jgi:hypothetical protein
MAACVAMLCLMLAEPAVAQRDCKPLPGRSGLDQYCESLPGATGDRSPGAGGGSGRDVSPSTRQRLERSGAEGRALLGLTGGPSDGGDRSAADGARGGESRREESAADGDGGGNSNREKSAADGDGGGKSRGGSSRSGNQKAANDSNDVLSAVSSAADSGASAGPVFIWVLVAVAVAIAGIAWVRYRVRGGAR